jgi:hypothetical protein
MPESIIKKRSSGDNVTYLNYHMRNIVVFTSLRTHTEVKPGQLGIATGYGLEGRALIPGRGKKFYSTMQCPERPTQPPVQWEPAILSGE